MPRSSIQPKLRSACDFLVVAIGAAFLCLPTPSPAGDWNLTPRFSVNQTVTDNVRQQEIDPTGDFITAVTPGLSLRGNGARINSNIDYNFRRSFFASNPQFDDGNHQLQGSTNIVLIKQHLTVNTNSSRSQQLTDNTGRISRNVDSRNGNRSDVQRFQVSPEWRQRFGNWANGSATFSFDKVTFSDDRNQNSGGIQTGDFGESNDSEEKEWSWTLTTGSKFSRTPASIAASRNETNRGDGENDKFERLNGSIGLIVSRKFRLNFEAGTESNEFQTQRSQNDGFSWSAGGTWTPSRRTSLQGSWGQRFFGNNLAVSVSHEHRRLNFSLNYNEELTTRNNAQRNIALVPLTDGFGNPFFDPVTSSTIEVPLDTVTVRNGATVSKSLALSIAYRLRRSNITGSFTDRRERFEGSGIEDRLRLMQVGYSRSISPRSSISTNFSWRQGSTSDSSGGDLLSVSASYSYNLGPHTSILMRYSFTDQGQAETGRPGYTENSVVANLVFHY